MWHCCGVFFISLFGAPMWVKVKWVLNLERAHLGLKDSKPLKDPAMVWTAFEWIFHSFHNFLEELQKMAQSELWTSKFSEEFSDSIEFLARSSQIEQRDCFLLCVSSQLQKKSRKYFSELYAQLKSNNFPESLLKKIPAISVYVTRSTCMCETIFHFN